MSRRYVVTEVTSSPGWEGTLWSTGCKHLASAEALFERKRRDIGPYAGLLLLDREERKVLKSVGCEDAEKTAPYFIAWWWRPG